MAETLESALAAFEKQRSKHITEAIEELGRAAVEGCKPPKVRTNVEYHAHWLELVLRPLPSGLVTGVKK